MPTRISEDIGNHPFSLFYDRSLIPYTCKYKYWFSFVLFKIGTVYPMMQYMSLVLIILIKQQNRAKGQDPQPFPPPTTALYIL